MPIPAALKVVLIPETDASTIFVPGFGPSVSVLCALPLASVVAVPPLNRPLRPPSPIVTVNAT